MLAEVENKLTQSLLKLEQYRTTSSNLEKDIEENTKSMNDQGFALSEIDSELKKLLIDIQNKTRQIDLENKQLETLQKKCEVSVKPRKTMINGGGCTFYATSLLINILSMIIGIGGGCKTHWKDFCKNICSPDAR